MTMRSVVNVAAVALCAGLCGCERQVSFAEDIQPIFLENCVECHDQAGEGILASGFSVNNYDSVMKGTKFGPVVVPGSSVSSALYLVVAQKTAPEIQMPPQHAEAWAEGRGRPLSEDEIETIRDWIDQGALDN